MKHQLKRRTRRGFTLVEVALAVAVGLIVIGGAILAFNAVKENAANSQAQSRLLQGVTIVEEFAGLNSGTFPASAVTGGNFSAIWAAKQGDARNDNPWGGATGNATGAIEVAACDFGAGTEAVAASLTDTPADLLPGGVAAANPAQTACLTYVSGNTPATPWSGIVQGSTLTTVVVRHYAVGICDKNGVPYWSVKGGK